jgi:hypothetical protein
MNHIKSKAVEWAIQAVILSFSAGGAYFTLKNHETRITGLEVKDEKRVNKEDFENRIKSLEWRLNRGR